MRGLARTAATRIGTELLGSSLPDAIKAEEIINQSFSSVERLIVEGSDLMESMQAEIDQATELLRRARTVYVTGTCLLGQEIDKFLRMQGKPNGQLPEL